MKHVKKLLSASLFSILSINTVIASSSFYDVFDGQFDASKYLSENAYGFLPVPIIITDPAVDGGLGMMGLFFHETEEEQQSRLNAMKNKENAAMHLMPPSVSAVFGAYTGNGSYFLGGGHMGFFNQGTIRYMGGGGYGDVNIDFYGFGDITLKKPLEIKTKATAIMQTLKFKLADSRFYFGPTQRYIDAQILPTNIDELTGNLPPEWQDPLTNVLTRNITTSGIGLALEYDSRDNIFSPTSGFSYTVNYLWFDETIGSDVDYKLTELTALNYFKVSENWRTNFKIEANYANSVGFLPPYATPSIDIRGIPTARYQGQSVAMSELEVVYKINFRWEVNAFAGIGKATNDFSEFSDSPSRISKGVGVRYLIARRYGFNMGLDVAQGPEDTIVYVQAGSAW